VKKRIVLIGPGRLGQTVIRLLQEAGHEIRAIISRDAARARAAARFAGCPGKGTTDLSRVREGEVVLIALPDDHIASMALLLRQRRFLAPRSVLVHFSGLYPAAALLGEDEKGLQSLSIHPLQTFADAVLGVRLLPGSPFAVEGSEEALPLAERLVEEMGGHPFRISGAQKPLYHAAACTASNYLITLASVAGEMLKACGLKDDIDRLMMPLISGTIRNLSALGPEAALTGPIARGDVETISKHLASLNGMPREISEIYRVMGRKTVDLALKKGSLEPQKGKEILQLLS